MLMKTEIRVGSRRHQAALHRGVPPVCEFASLGVFERMAFTGSYPLNTEIYGEEEPAEYLYKVVSGAVRTYRMLENGRRQIAAFYVPGDVFGLETRDEHALSAEAVTQSKLLLVKRRDLLVLASQDNVVARLLWTLTAAELQRVQDHILLFAMSASSVSRASSWRWPGVSQPTMKSNYQWRAAILQIISGSRSRQCLDRLRIWKTPPQSKYQPHDGSNSATILHLAV